MSTSPLGRKGVTSATVDPCLSGTCGVCYIFMCYIYWSVD